MQRKIQILILFIIGTLTTYGQANFEKGYIITNDNKRIDCEIDNKDWENNPQKIKYRINDQIISGSLTDIKAFEIYDYGHYERCIVSISNSTTAIEESPDYVEKTDTLFLKVLLKGNPSLFYYLSGYFPVYFYQTTKDNTPIQLKHRVSRFNSKVVENNFYRDQIAALGQRCGRDFENDIKLISYRSSSLLTVFKKINNCNNSAFEIQQQRKKYTSVRFQVRPGFTLNKLNVFPSYDKSESGPYAYKSGFKPSYRLGMAMEIRSSARLKNWSGLIEASYEGLKDSKMITDENKVYANVKNIDLLIGPRRYFQFTKNFSFYAGLYAGINAVPLKSQVDYKYVYSSSKIETELYPLHRLQSLFGVAGAGIKYKKAGLELAYTFPYKILREDTWSSNYSGIQIIGSFDLF